MKKLVASLLSKEGGFVVYCCEGEASEVVIFKSEWEFVTAAWPSGLYPRTVWEQRPVLKPSGCRGPRLTLF